MKKAGIRILVLLFAVLVGWKLKPVSAGIGMESEKVKSNESINESGWILKGRRHVNPTISDPYDVQVIPLFKLPIDIQLERLLWTTGNVYFVYSYYLDYMPTEEDIHSYKQSFIENGFSKWENIPLEGEIGILYDQWGSIDYANSNNPVVRELFKASEFSGEIWDNEFRMKFFHFEDKQKNNLFMTGINCLVSSTQEFCKIETMIRDYTSPEEDYENRKEIIEHNKKMLGK